MRFRFVSSSPGGRAINRRDIVIVGAKQYILSRTRTRLYRRVGQTEVLIPYAAENDDDAIPRPASARRPFRGNVLAARRARSDFDRFMRSGGAGARGRLLLQCARIERYSDDCFSVFLIRATACDIFYNYVRYTERVRAESTKR